MVEEVEPEEPELGELYEYVGVEYGCVVELPLVLLLDGVVVPELDGEVVYAPTGSLIVSPASR